MIETIQKIQEAKTIIARDVPNDMRLYAGHQMAKAEASRSLETLYKQLAEDVAQVAVPVYVSGSTGLQLARSMQLQTPSAVVDLNDIYRTVFDAIAPTIGRSREFGVSQFATFLREIRQLAAANGLAAVQTPQFGEPVVVNDDAKLMETVVNLCEKAVGAELAVNYVRKQAGEQAVKVIEAKVPVFPVFILNAPADLQPLLTKKLFKRNLSAAIEAPSEVTEEAAIDALKTIKKTLKNTKEI